MKTNTLNIVNGQVMYTFFQEKGFLKDETIVSFNEAMCYGMTSSSIFSTKFLETRSKVHNVSLDQYKNITLKAIQPLLSKKFNSLTLWFDCDMFCQINILTILAWLDQIDYQNTVTLVLVDDEFKPIEKQTLHPKGYKEIYHQVLIEKQTPGTILPHSLQRGIQLYLQYHNPDSELMMYIHEHRDLPEEELVVLLLNKFNEYGLGDAQYIELIRANRSAEN
ncbi:AraC family transcriptional regulator [Metabacillus halosaccharovorans]|uniref:AraC family transcriptional regulator n=1 Tax=Metabacillus halosaccharovorans TaxID=930124 RepID=A0ABT3DKH4_9BACI|nr:AraC family transcriptional regulator [Metabacillus halosaccharovorans]MCV9887016.1 AraC family transcriptional regulator [Metabacillus halosaccharovorans]